MSARVAGTTSTVRIGDQPETSTALPALLTPSKDPTQPIHHPEQARGFPPNPSYTTLRDVTPPVPVADSTATDVTRPS